MIDMTYDPEADAAYIHLSKGTIDGQEEHGPFICDVDRDGRIIGIEVVSASQVLAPGSWRDKARLPGSGKLDAAE